MASSVLTDSRWIARGAERTSLSRFLLWLSALGRLARDRCLRGWSLPVLRAQPDQHGQPLRFRAVDLSRSRHHCAGSWSILHRISCLYPEAELN